MKYGWLLVSAAAGVAVAAAVKAYRHYEDEHDIDISLLPNREAVLAFREANRRRSMAEAQIECLERMYYGRNR